MYMEMPHCTSFSTSQHYPKVLPNALIWNWDFLVLSPRKTSLSLTFSSFRLLKKCLAIQDKYDSVLLVIYQIMYFEANTLFAQLALTCPQEESLKYNRNKKYLVIFNIFHIFFSLKNIPFGCKYPFWSF